MRSFIVLCLTLLLSCFQIHAQGTRIHVGMAGNRLSFLLRGTGSDQFDWYAKTPVGIQAGIEFQLSDQLAIGAGLEMGYAQKRSLVDGIDNELLYNGQPGPRYGDHINLTITSRVWMGSLPLYVQIDPGVQGKGIFFSLGTEFAFSSLYLGFFGRYDDGQLAEDNDDNVRLSFIGTNVGIGYRAPLDEKLALRIASRHSYLASLQNFRDFSMLSNGLGIALEF